MAADAPITQMVDTAAFAHSHTLVSTVKRKLIIAVPIPVPMELAVKTLEILIYASARKASLGDTVMITWMTVLPFPAKMVAHARMGLMTIPVPALLGTRGKTAACLSANVSTTHATTGQHAMRETTVMCANVLMAMVDLTASFCCLIKSLIP